jgi:hypothetical protein
MEEFMSPLGILVILVFLCYIGGIARGYNPLAVFLTMMFVIVLLFSAFSRPMFHHRGYYMGQPTCGSFNPCYTPYRMTPPYFGPRYHY